MLGLWFLSSRVSTEFFLFFLPSVGSRFHMIFFFARIQPRVPQPEFFFWPHFRARFLWEYFFLIFC